MAGGGELKLLGLWTIPYVIRVRVALNLKSLPYDYVEEEVRSKSALLLASNPVHKKVPVLIHNGRPIQESQVIVQYLDEAFAGTGPCLLPSDPYDRATACFWAAFVDDKVGAAWFTMLFERKTEEKMKAAAWAMAALETLEGAFRDLSKGKAPFFGGGDGIGLVDVVLGGYVGWFVVIEKMIGVRLLDAARTSAVAAWAERIKAADAVKGIPAEDIDRVLEFLPTVFD